MTLNEHSVNFPMMANQRDVTGRASIQGHHEKVKDWEKWNSRKLGKKKRELVQL